jgi:mediator of RNA polymerase II transcription subunit 13
MGMDIDMDFGLDMGMGFSMGDGGDNGMDFEDAFTEDDFSFFDQPSANTSDHIRPPGSSTLSTEPMGRGGVVAGVRAGTGIGPAVTPPHFPHDLHLRGPIISSDSGPGPPLVSPVQQPPHSISNSISHLQASPFDFNVLTPYLLPPSPSLVPTPSSHFVPPTPTVHLEPDMRSTTTARIFDPIPFATYHRTLDGKYALGKFAFPSSLPSPPDEEDQTKDFILRKSCSPNSSSVDKDRVAVQEIEKEVGVAVNGWRSKYLAATDPRIGVVRKLVGVKRKIFVQGGRESVGDIHGTKKLMSPAWIREHEDWERLSSPKEDADSRIEADSESEEDEDSYEESPIVSRPSTPTPAYLPLGPTLLSTHFEHSQLLPLCTPLRPPGAAVAPTNITVSAPAASVPTPVSPAAAASDQSKSLEAAALTLATEVVENPPWADAWRASSIGARQPPEVWPADVRAISQLFEAVPGLESPLDIATLFGSEAQGQAPSSSKNTQKPVQLLESPMISIGKGDAVIQILPTALWFWEKLGLGPRGGRKNGTAYILFEDDGEQRQQQVESWLATVSATYEVGFINASLNKLHSSSLFSGKTSRYSYTGKFWCLSEGWARSASL